MPFATIDLTGMDIDTVTWGGASLEAAFGDGYGARALVGSASGLHRWVISSTLLVDSTDYGYPIGGFPSFEYYWEFFKTHTTGATDVFIIEFREKQYHASFVNKEMTAEMFTIDLFGAGGGLEIRQRRVVGETYNADGSIVVEGLDADAEAFLTATGITDETIEAAIDDLVVALKADGIWDVMGAIYPFVGSTADTHKYNLKDPQDTDGAFRITWSGSVNHAADGVTGAGGYGNTHWNPTTETAANEGSCGVYVEANGSASSVELGAHTSGTESMYIATNFGGNHLHACNGAELSTAAGAAGFHQLSRPDGSNHNYKVANGAVSSGVAAYNAPNFEVYILSRNTAGVQEHASARTVSFAYLGGTLTSGELDDFYTAVQAFQTALGRNV